MIFFFDNTLIFAAVSPMSSRIYDFNMVEELPECHSWLLQMGNAMGNGYLATFLMSVYGWYVEQVGAIFMVASIALKRFDAEVFRITGYSCFHDVEFSGVSLAVLFATVVLVIVDKVAKATRDRLETPT